MNPQSDRLYRSGNVQEMQRKSVAIDGDFSRTQGHRNTITPCERKYKHTHTFHVSSTPAAAYLHIDPLTTSTHPIPHIIPQC